MEIIIIIVISIIIIAISKLVQKINDLKNINESLRQTLSELKNVNNQNLETIDSFKRIEQRLNQRIQQQGQKIHDAKNECNRIRKLCEDAINRKDKEVMTILNEASQGFPWLSRAIANYEFLKDFQRSEYLESKKHPALKAAAHIREVAAQSREYRIEYNIVRSRLDYYEALFPWIEEYVDIDLDTLIAITKDSDEEQKDADPVRHYMTTGEYEQLSTTERNQLALDRYLTKKKSPWQLGRDYERFIGYRFEQDGYDVEYFGIFEGLSDLGRDLIVRKGNDIKIVQCKYWAKNKTIHEKHIAQLFGTTIKYKIEKGNSKDSRIMGVFITSTTLSDMARSFAQQLDITVHELVSLKAYPLIKCNISRDKDGFETKIYHLPMDQQYDSTKINKPGECYVNTVVKAERLGFRRAWQWYPENVR